MRTKSVNFATTKSDDNRAMISRIDIGSRTGNGIDDTIKTK